MKQHDGMDYWRECDQYEDDEWEERVERFADPGGTSALHPATRSDPRDQSCPSCGWPNRLTRADRARGYQCDSCADAAEHGTDIAYYEEAEPDTREQLDADAELEHDRWEP